MLHVYSPKEREAFVFARHGLALTVVLVLTVGACETTHSHTTSCSPLKSPHVAAGGSQPMTVEFGNLTTVEFNRSWWKLASPGPSQYVKLHGTMTLWRNDVSVFRSDDGRTFSFSPTVVGCL